MSTWSGISSPLWATTTNNNNKQENKTFKELKHKRSLKKKKSLEFEDFPWVAKSSLSREAVADTQRVSPCNPYTPIGYALTRDCPH